MKPFEFFNMYDAIFDDAKKVENPCVEIKLGEMEFCKATDPISINKVVLLLFGD